MDTTKEVVQEIRRILRRRKKLLIITPIIFVLISISVLQFIEPKYESSTTILVQSEESLNPLVVYEMGVSPSSENLLNTFDEIIFSRSAMEMLIDSLGIGEQIETRAERQALVRGLQNKVTTDLSGTGSFKITMTDTDPVQARDGVELLVDYFISTRSKLEGKRNAETVEFFTSKLNELDKMMDKQRQQLLNSTTEQINEVPVDRTELQTKVREIESQINEVDLQIIEEENKLDALIEFLNQDPENTVMDPLYKLPMEDLSFGETLQEQLEEYDDLNQQYTESYPRIQTLKQQIRETANRIPSSVESKLVRLRDRREDLLKERAESIEDMEKSYIANQQSRGNQSVFEVYEDLYGDMKVKLEQARMSQEIGSKTSIQYEILDPPYVAEQPSSPNKRLMVGGSFILGVILGAILIGIAEILDTTIRSEKDLKLKKPVIAYLSDGKI